MPDGKLERWSGPAGIAWCDEHGLHGARDHCFECNKPVEQIQMISVGELRLAAAALEGDASAPCGNYIRTLDLVLAAVGCPLPTDEEVEAARTTNGGWTRSTLARWGVAWPPKAGWRKVLQRRRDLGSLRGAGG